MKTFYLTALLSAFIIAASAQTQQGSINLNGQFGTNRGGTGQVSPNSLVKTFSLQLNPNVGYFIKDNWELGAGIVFGTTQTRYKQVIQNNPEKYSSNDLGLRMYSKYYFGSGVVKPYITASGGYNWFNNETKYLNANTISFTSRYWTANGGVGLAWFASKRVGLFSQLTYDKNWNGGTYSSNTLNLNFGVQINLGKK